MKNLTIFLTFGLLLAIDLGLYCFFRSRYYALWIIRTLLRTQPVLRQ